MEHRSARLVILGPEPAAVRLNDRPADWQSHSDALWLGREKRRKQPIRMRCIDSRASICNGYQDFTRIRTRGLNYQPLRFRIDTGSGLNGIHHQVENDLLQLNPVG